MIERNLSDRHGFAFTDENLWLFIFFFSGDYKRKFEYDYNVIWLCG